MHDHAQSIIRRHIEDARQAAKLDADDPVRAEGHHIYAVLLELIADEIAAALDSRAGDAGEDHNGGRCPGCDGTGDVHRIDGEWLGTCHCPAGTFSNPSTFGKPTFGVAATPAPAVDTAPAGEVGRLREALQWIATHSNCDWEQVRKHPAKHIDIIHEIAVDALFNRALSHGEGR